MVDPIWKKKSSKQDVAKEKSSVPKFGFNDFCHRWSESTQKDEPTWDGLSKGNVGPLLTLSVLCGYSNRIESLLFEYVFKIWSIEKVMEKLGEPSIWESCSVDKSNPIKS